MKKFLAHGVAGAVALSIGAWSVPADAETILKVTGALPTNHDYIDAFKETFLKPLNAEKGAISMNFLGGPEVTPRQKQVPSLKRGLVDVVVSPAAYYGTIVTEARLPGLQNKSLEEMKKNGAWDMLQEAHAKKANARILAWTHFRGQTFFIYTNFKPKLSEKTGISLKGRKMRSTGLYNAFLRAMGATTVVISPGDVYAGLERGVVDGLAWPSGSTHRLGWQRFLKYRIEPNFFGATVMTLINNDKFNSLSKAERDLLMKHAANYQEKSQDIAEQKAKEDDVKLKEAGVEFYKLPGKYAKAYIDTIYGAKWAENDKLKYTVDYKKLKSLMFTPK